jgi:gluconate 5-dehydrogenase
MTGSLKELFDLSGRVAIVTGGSRGLGLQIAAALGEYGARVALVSRKQQDLDIAVRALADSSIEARSFAADLGNESVHQTLVEQVLAAFGRIDILINNAGATWGARAEEYPVHAWEKVMRLNVSSAFFLTQAVARGAFLGNGGGSVVNISSITALMGHHTGQIGTVAYNTSKGALLSMTRALAAEWGPHDIRVNALAPGYFPSKMTAATLKEHGERMIAQTPLGRLGGPADLKGPALLLASDAGRHITGQYIVVDGGMSIV